MKGFLTTILTPIIFLLIYAEQPAFEPTVIILNPHEVVKSPAIAEELSMYDEETEVTNEIRKNYIREGLAENWRIIREHELEFSRKQDFASMIAFMISRDITYREVQHHENLLIFPVKETNNGDRNNYKALAEKYKVSWIVNIVKLELYQTGDRRHAKAKVQLYNASSGWLFIDTTYTAGDAASPDVCEQGSWLCVAENIKNLITKDIVDKIERNRHHHKPR